MPNRKRLDQPGSDELTHRRFGNADVTADADEPDTPFGNQPSRGRWLTSSPSFGLW
jgi:hypothetical protein